MPTPVPAVARASRLLELLAADPQARPRLSELAQRAGIHKATCAAILAELTAQGLVTRHADGPAYSLGPQLVGLGAASAEQHPGLVPARREMRALAAELGLGCFVTVPLGDEMLVLDRAFDPALADLAATIPVGLRAPLHPPLGTVFYAWAPEAVVDEWLTRVEAPADPREQERLRRALAAVRLRGWSAGSRVEVGLPLDEMLERLAQADAPEERMALTMRLAELIRREHEDPAHVVDDDAGRGAQLLLAPAFGPGGRVVLSLTLFGRPSQFGPGDVPRFTAALVAAGRRVTAAIGGHVPVVG